MNFFLRWRIIKYVYKYLIIEILRNSTILLFYQVSSNIISYLVSWENYLKLLVEQSSSSFHSSTRDLAHLSL